MVWTGYPVHAHLVFYGKSDTRHFPQLKSIKIMCLYQRYIKNPYTGKDVYVKCGHCNACLQEKAARRTSRIRNNVSSGQTALFVTLTYANIFVPYVRRSELKSFEFSVPVYRDASIRRNRVGSDYKFFKTIKRQTSKIANIDYDNSINFLQDGEKVPEVDRLLHLKRYSKDKIGVVLYSDLQRFYKRLRVILQRKYQVTSSFSYFGCAEYGPSTKRPHFHVLIFVPSSETQLYISAISEAWQFDSISRKRKGIQIARNASSYVSAYVNSNTRLSKFYTLHSIKPRHSYSQGFGMQNPFFSFENVVKSSEKSDFGYNKTIMRNSIPTVIDCAIPKYVIDKFFPRFLGYSSMPTDSLLQLLQCPTFNRCISYIGSYYRSNFPYDGYHMSDDGSSFDIAQRAHVLSVKLLNWQKRMFERGYDAISASYLHLSVHRQYTSYLYKREYEDIQNLDDFEQHYDNIRILLRYPEISPTLHGISLKYNSPNEYPNNIEQTISFERAYQHYDKSRKLNNTVMSCALQLNV